jgi:hypothetical protein
MSFLLMQLSEAEDKSVSEVFEGGRRRGRRPWAGRVVRGSGGGATALLGN